MIRNGGCDDDGGEKTDGNEKKKKSHWYLPVHVRTYDQESEKTKNTRHDVEDDLDAITSYVNQYHYDISGAKVIFHLEAQSRTRAQANGSISDTEVWFFSCFIERRAAAPSRRFVKRIKHICAYRKQLTNPFIYKCKSSLMCFYCFDEEESVMKQFDSFIG